MANYSQMSVTEMEQEFARTHPAMQSRAKHQAELDAAFSRDQQLREEAIRRARGMEGVYQRGVDALRQQQQAGNMELRRQAAQGLAGALGSGQGGLASGARLAGAGQVARERGMASAQFGADMADRIQKQRQDAAQAGLEGTIFEKEARGDVFGNRQKRMQDYEQQIQGYIAASDEANFFGVDEDEVARQIRNLAQFETDPYIRNWLMRRAAQVQNS